MHDAINHYSPIFELEKVVTKVKKAQTEFSSFPQDKVDRIIKNIAETAFEKANSLAELAVEETGMGNAEHKKIKNELGSVGVYESIKDEKTVGIIHQDKKNKVTEIAYPFGVIAAICPITNPTSTAIFKTIISLKALNGIVVSPHPGAKRSTVEALKICHEAAVEAGAPEGIIGWISQPTMEVTTALMKDRNIDLILATGGSGLVKAAYSSGKPAYGVGSGNGPVYLEKTANVSEAIKMIVSSKTFDNGTLCSTEQSIVVHKNIKQVTLRELKNNRAYILNAAEKKRIEQIISPKEGELNPQIVGRSASKIAAMAGIQVPSETTVLIAEETHVSKKQPFSIEKLAPIFPLYTINNENEAHELCIKLLNLGGRGHTCSIHSKDDKAIQAFGLQMPVSRIIVNTLASIGAAGGTTGLIPSLTLGCGSYGGNISSDNITTKHLYNTKRIAYGIKDISIPNPTDSKKLSELASKNITDEVAESLQRKNEFSNEIDPEEVAIIVRDVIQKLKK